LLVGDRDGNRCGVSAAPNVSIVIPTYNRRERLARVLRALDRQTVDPARFEVVVVDDGSTDGTAGWLARQRRTYALRVISQDNAGPARARNAGVEAAREPMLLFLDDDVEPAPELVEEHFRSQGHDADSVVIGPLASLPYYRQPWVAWEQARLEVQYAAMIRGDYEPTFRQFWTGNASVRREHVIAAGGFDARILRGEDVELGYRLARLGLKFRFNPAARGLHYAERSLDSWERAHLSYGSLEVGIFECQGEDTLIEILASNWARLHPATRWLVRRCLAEPGYYAGARLLLRKWLEAGAAIERPIFAHKVCGVLANVLYWQASVQALGPERALRLSRRGDELARTYR
jgi:glycosyltransferase involved in cell wall biosynthesis